MQKVNFNDYSKITVHVNETTGGCYITTPWGMNPTDILSYLTAAIEAVKEKSHLTSKMPKVEYPN